MCASSKQMQQSPSQEEAQRKPETDARLQRAERTGGELRV